MTAAVIHTFLDHSTTDNYLTSTCTYNPDMDRRSSILGSLRNKFSKNSDKSESRLSRVMSFKSARSGGTQEFADNNPYSTTSTPTTYPSTLLRYAV